MEATVQMSMDCYRSSRYLKAGVLFLLVIEKNFENKKAIRSSLYRETVGLIYVVSGTSGLAIRWADGGPS